MSWEERMAARAKERRVKAETEARRTEDANDPHGGHHEHLDGTAVYCSCGEFLGVTCVAVPFFETEEEAKAYYNGLGCPLCGTTGLVLLGT
jgi:hypothetical protein